MEAYTLAPSASATCTASLSRLGLAHRVAHQHDRVLRLGEYPDCLLQGGVVGSGTVARWARGLRVQEGLSVERVCRQGYERWARWRGCGLLEGPPEYAGYLVRVGYLDAPLGEHPGHLRQLGATVGQLAHVLVAGGEHERGAPGVGVMEEAEAVGESGLDVQVDE